MPNLPPMLFLLLAALAGLIAGLLLLYLVSRRWVGQAQHAGRASRDAEVATLSEQRESAVARGGELAARIERYERDWSSAEQNLRKLSAHAAAQQTQAEQLGHQLPMRGAAATMRRTRLVDLTRQHAALEAGAKEHAQAATEKLQLLEQGRTPFARGIPEPCQQDPDDKAERFREQSSQQLGGLLDPLKLQLKEFRETINTTHASEQRERGMLAQESRR